MKSAGSFLGLSSFCIATIGIAGLCMPLFRAKASAYPLPKQESVEASTATSISNCDIQSGGTKDQKLENRVLEYDWEKRLSLFEDRLNKLEELFSQRSSRKEDGGQRDIISSSPEGESREVKQPKDIELVKSRPSEPRIVEKVPASEDRIARDKIDLVLKKVEQIERRFNKAQSDIKINQLTLDDQVELAMHSPLGKELLKKLEILDGKLDNLTAKQIEAEVEKINGRLFPGLAGTYYSDRFLEKPVASRIDALINFSWGQNAPEPLNGQGDRFSIRWEGYVQIPYSGKYQFFLRSDDGIRVWIGNQLVMNSWDDHAAKEDYAELTLQKGAYPVKIEFYENGGHALAQLFWKLPDGEREIIPAEAFYHTGEQEKYFGE